MNLLNEAQEQQLQEISKHLVQVRQEKGIRIEEVAARTNIRLLFLECLDAGKFAELPEPVYIQGFIRRYADVLGLDGQALAKTFTVNVEPLTHQLTHQFHKDETEPIKKDLTSAFLYLFLTFYYWELRRSHSFMYSILN